VEDVRVLIQQMDRTYSVDELKERPPGLDTSHLETYLSESDFVAVFKMSMEEWKAIPVWKKLEQRKAVGLF